MRKDMPQLLCERPRTGGGNGGRKLKRQHRRKLNSRDPEDLPRRESSSGHRLYGYDSKNLNEFLNPLARFLESRVGKVWDDVYSELRENLRLDSAVHLHIMEHLWSYVDKNVWMSDQGVLVKPDRYTRYPKYVAEGNHTVNGRKGWRKIGETYGRWNFFVHPESGLLCRVPMRKREKTVAPKTTHVEDGRVFKKDDGIWYEMKLVPLPDGRKWGESVRKVTPALIIGNEVIRRERVTTEYGPRDVFFGPLGGEPSPSYLRTPSYVRLPNFSQIRSWYGTLKVYCPGERRQINSSELRKYGLKND